MGLDWSEILLVLLVGLLVFGPRPWVGLSQSLQRSPTSQARPTARDRRLLALAMILLLGQLTLFALEKAGVITSIQHSITLSVVIIWLIVGWLCFDSREE